MGDLTVRQDDRHARLTADFGQTARRLPDTVAKRLRWRRMAVDYSATGWPVVFVSGLEWQDLVAIPELDLERAVSVARAALEPSQGSDCLAATLRLQAVARRRSTIAEDEELSLVVYADKLARYPADAVAAACERWLETSPFWPSVSELLQACEWAMQPRRELVQALTKALQRHADAPQERDNRIAELRQAIGSYGHIHCSYEQAQAAESELAAIEQRPALDLRRIDGDGAHLQ